MIWKKSLIALKLTEEKNTALGEAKKEQKSVHNVFEESKFVKEGWKTHCDNESCIKISHETGDNWRAKHNDLLYLAMLDIPKHQEIQISCFKSAQTRSDIMTKFLSTQEHNHAVIGISLAELQWEEEFFYMNYSNMALHLVLTVERVTDNYILDFITFMIFEKNLEEPELFLEEQKAENEDV